VALFDLNSIVFGASEEVLTATFGCNISSTSGAGSSAWSILGYGTTGDEFDPRSDTAANLLSRAATGNVYKAALTDFRTTGVKSIALTAGGVLTDINACINTGTKLFALAIKMDTETGPTTWSQIDAYTESSPPTLTLVIGVPATNVPPIADAGPDQNVDEGDVVTLDGTGSTDPDGTISAYLWEQIAGISVTLSSTTASQPTFTAPAVAFPSSLQFRLTVTDNNAATHADTVYITVLDVPSNLPPIANAGADQTRYSGETTQLTGAGSSDPESQPLTYQWTQTQGPVVSLSSATVQQPTFITPTVSVPTVLVFSLTVFDGVLLSSADTVTITALPILPVASVPFSDVANVALNIVVTSNLITISGIGTVPATLTITGGEYSKNGGAYTSDPGTCVDGDTIVVKVTSSTQYNTTITASVYVNGTEVG
jgi:hypothetical protein